MRWLLMFWAAARCYDACGAEGDTPALAVYLISLLSCHDPPVQPK